METADTAALLLLDLPHNALAGIDLLAFTTTPRFQGVKNLPFGVHFTFLGTSSAFSERHGLWFYIGEDASEDTHHSLLVAKWDPISDTLLHITDQTEILRQRANLGNIWREGLTPYRQSSSNDSSERVEEDPVDWENLTSSITPTLLHRILSNDDDQSWTLSSGSSAKQDLETIPGLDDLNSTTSKTLSFLPIDLKQTWDPSVTGRARSEAAQDRSWALNDLVSRLCSKGKDEEVLGELQFTFVMVLTINNFSCFEQWKRLLSLLLTCREVVLQRSQLFVKVLRTLRLQLQHCKVADSGLIDLSDEGGSLLRSLLGKFRKGVEGLKGMGVQDVVDELEELEEYLHEEHGWQFGGAFPKGGVLELEDGEEIRVAMGSLDDEEDETGEYAPQIVDLTPEQARLLNVEGAEGLDVRLDKARLQEVEEEDNEGNDPVEQSTEHVTTAGHAESEDEDEDMQELDEMDARY